MSKKNLPDGYLVGLLCTMIILAVVVVIELLAIDKAIERNNDINSVVNASYRTMNDSADQTIDVVSTLFDTIDNPIFEDFVALVAAKSDGGTTFTPVSNDWESPVVDEAIDDTYLEIEQIEKAEAVSEGNSTRDDFDESSSSESESAEVDTDTFSSAEVNAVDDSNTDINAEKQTYNGIAEGDVFDGTLTYYDVCIKCCGKTDGITALGIRIQNGVQPETPVASCNWLPLGTLIDIDGTQYIVADRGGKSLGTVGRVDIFTPEGHQAALDLGRKTGAVITVLKFPDGLRCVAVHDS